MRTYSRRKPQCQAIDGVKDLCRLCLEKPEGAVPIFPQEPTDVCSALSTRIMFCVGLEMFQDDHLPDIICSNCNSELEKCYKFRKMCHKTYQKLKLHLQSFNMHDEYNQNIKQNQIETSVENVNIECIDNNKSMIANEDEYIYMDKSNLVLVFNDSNAEIQNEMNVVESTESVHQNVEQVDGNTLHEILNCTIDNIPGCDKNDETDSQKQLPCQPAVHQDTISSTPALKDVVIEPKIATYIRNELIETGVMALQEGTIGVPHDMTTVLELVTEDGFMVTMHLDECDQQEDCTETDENLQSEYELNNKMQEPHSILLVDLDKRMQGRNGVRGKKNARAGRAECARCGATFSRRSALARHAAAHAWPRPHACTRCPRRFTQKEVLKRHLLVHDERRPFACSSCPKSFTQRGALTSHERAHAPPSARALSLHACALCPKIFLYASGLSRHMKTHSGRVYTCGECLRPFKDKSSLRRHLKANQHRAATAAAAVTNPSEPQ